ncbi:amphi-Trp domain-containing protein [Metasolibacillus meyeri]|uniref:Amphi-Trp domain-containing protein n=1 Tax=Metasolibacillus meyeri TaxID=1071052 RepID=A0AAW9NX27_9BACL|nr:amphi-Trp domain-containing protein [Metasolibacillus meyeri]MEC1178988.1 amphi-Trp domain-containing protein [Metasolibacillus meyeri]
MLKPNKPVTEVLIKHKEHQNVVEFATMLEAIAKKLKESGAFTFVQGTEQTIVHPSEQLKIEYSYTKKGDKHSFEIEFDWYTGEQTRKKMMIE